MVRRAMRPGTTRLTGDDFKAAQPDYRQLLRQDPRGASTAIRADYRAWFARAEEYVRLRRGDLLIEAAPEQTSDEDHAYFVGIAHFMAGLPLDDPSPAQWIDGEPATRSRWRALVTARREHLGSLR